MKKIRVGTLIFALLVPVAVGVFSAALSASGMDAYGNMNKPPLSPPAWLFPIAWTILYLMMGMASYYILVSETEGRCRAKTLALYAVQLAMNFMWSIVFFNWKMYLFAFVWLIVMWCVVIICAFRFYRIHKWAGYMMIPYILWLSFAAYLNMGAYLLNR